MGQMKKKLDTIATGVLSLSTNVSKLRLVETAIVAAALKKTGGNKSAAARLLNVNRKTLERKALRGVIDDIPVVRTRVRPV